MIQASLQDFVQLVLIFVLIYFGLKILFRLFGPAIMRWVMKRIGKKVEKKFSQNSGFQTTEDQKKKQKKTGKTSIHKKNDSKKKKYTSTNNDVGEYIDYEEVD